MTREQAIDWAVRRVLPPSVLFTQSNLLLEQLPHSIRVIDEIRAEFRKIMDAA